MWYGELELLETICTISKPSNTFDRCQLLLYAKTVIQCFDKYAEQEEVYSVSGYSWPIILPENEYDVYGCGRISSW